MKRISLILVLMVVFASLLAVSLQALAVEETDVWPDTNIAMGKNAYFGDIADGKLYNGLTDGKYTYCTEDDPKYPGYTVQGEVRSLKNGEYVTIDLEEIYSVKSIRLGSYVPKKGRIMVSVSTDGSNWNNVWDTATETEARNYKNEFTPLEIGPNDARYVKVTLEEDISGNFNFNEIAIYPNACAHVVAEYEITTEPTCVSTGIKKGLCSVCNKVVVAVAEAGGHKEQVIEGYAATCTEAGLSDGKYCSVCDTVYSEQTEIAPLGHAISNPTVVDPTCTEEGSSSGICSRCQEVAVITLPAKGHTKVVIPAPNDEYVDGIKCSVCSEILMEPLEIVSLGKTATDGSSKTTILTDGLTASDVDTYLWLGNSGKWGYKDSDGNKVKYDAEDNTCYTVIDFDSVCRISGASICTYMNGMKLSVRIFVSYDGDNWTEVQGGPFETTGMANLDSSTFITFDAVECRYAKFMIDEVTHGRDDFIMSVREVSFFGKVAKELPRFESVYQTKGDSRDELSINYYIPTVSLEGYKGVELVASSEYAGTVILKPETVVISGVEYYHYTFNNFTKYNGSDKVIAKLMAIDGDNEIVCDYDERTVLIYDQMKYPTPEEAKLLFERSEYSVTDVYISTGGTSLPYRLYVPVDYDPDKEYPLVLHFHGAGEAGSHNEHIFMGSTIVQNLLEPSVQENDPCIILAPQCGNTGDGGKWVNSDWTPGFYDHTTFTKSPYMTAAEELLQEVLDSYSVDENRLYVTGMSMGGYATWDIISRNPDKFAAAIPICGGIDVSYMEGLRGMPIRTFHCNGDSVVSCAGTVKANELLKDHGDFLYTEYNVAVHDAWSRAYAEEWLISWMFAQSLTYGDQRPCDVNGHTVVEIPELLPTCTESGLTAGSKCGVCNETLVAQTVIPALVHKENTNSDGTVTCLTCGALLSGVITPEGENLASGLPVILGWNKQESTVLTDGAIKWPYECATIPRENFSIKTSDVYYQIDLGASYDIDCLRVAGADYGGYFYYWEAYGTNDLNMPIDQWTKLTEKKNDISQASDANMAMRYPVTAEGEYRYIRIYGTFSNEKAYHMFHVSEIEVYGTKTKEVLPTVEYATLALSSDIAIRFYIPKASLMGYENLKLTVSTVGISAFEVNVSDLESVTVDGKEYYVYTFAKITPSKAGDDVTVVLSGINQSGALYTKEVVYSVKTYCENQIAESNDAKLKTLCVDLLNFCSAVQTFKGYNTSVLANSGLTEEQKALATSDHSSLVNVMEINGTVDGVAFESAGLFLNSAITLRIKVQADSIDGVVATVNGEKAELTAASDGYFYIYCNVESAADYASVINIKLEKNGAVTELCYSIPSYAYRMAEKPGASNELKTVCKTLLKYITAIEKYEAK